jgi:peptide deformylase
MAIRPVIRMGDPILNQVARPVEDIHDVRIAALITDMLDTMRAEDGAGLAAPQIGVSLRVVVFGFDRNPRYTNVPPVPRTILINPEIRPLSAEMEDGWEGCLSVPGLRGVVPRYQRIEYRGFNVEGEAVSVEAEGFHARVVQHECDHLDGILYPQRITDFSRFGFMDELAAADLLDMQPCDTP